MPWDNHGALTNTEKLISSTVGEWYAAKHREASVEEIVLINSHIPSACPYCGAKVFIRKGFYSNGIQRYQCKICDQKFSPLTNTIFDSRKIPFSEWIEYLIHLFEFHSITTSARDNRNSGSTGKYWLIKVFSVLKDVQASVMLHGKVYIDEMFFTRYPRDLILKEGKKAHSFVNAGEAVDHPHWELEKRCGDLYGLFRVEEIDPPGMEEKRRVYYHRRENSGSD
jgi:transposase-like protein